MIRKGTVFALSELDQIKTNLKKKKRFPSYHELTS